MRTGPRITIAPPLAALLAILALLGFAAPRALAQGATTQPLDWQNDSPASVEQLLDRLNSKDYETRERATEQLITRRDLDIERLAELYKSAESLEQRHRLRRVARHHLVRNMAERIFDQQRQPGAIGIYHHAVPADALPGLNRPAVEVVRSMPGLPAYGRLRPGDLIVGVNDEDLPTRNVQSEFQEWIQDEMRGDEISLTVVRQGERRTVKFKLGAQQALQNVYQGANSPYLLHAPFRDHWQNARTQLLQQGPEPRPLRVPDEPTTN